MNSRQRKQLKEMLSIAVCWDQPLSEHTSMGVGGPADALVTVVDGAELEALAGFIRKNGLPWRVLGGGTNLLVRDEGFAGIVIALAGKFKEFGVREEVEHIVIEAGAGCTLTRILSTCLEKGYSGLEFSIGIPGTLGGAVVMNAGAWGCCLGDVIQSVEVLAEDGRQTIAKNRLHFSYRRTILPVQEPFIVCSAEMRLKQMDPAEVRRSCRQYRELRMARQPTGFGSAGSIFKNPQGDSAGRLIEASGLKGLRIGDAEVSTKHANFIVNRGKARAEDVLKLIAGIQEEVARNTGVTLEPEVIIL